MKKIFILLSLIGVGAPIVASQDPMAINVETTKDNGSVDITVSVDGGIPPYNVEVTDQVLQIGAGPGFVFSDLPVGSYVVTVTDSDDPPQELSQEV